MPVSGIDWAALLLIVFIGGGIVLAFFLYLRTAYRKGGWRQVRTSLLLAIIALVALYIIRVAQNSELQVFKDIAKHGTK